MAMATPRRRFQLLDAMILVAATATGCAGMQWISQLLSEVGVWSSISENWRTTWQSISQSSTTLDLVSHLSLWCVLVAVLAMPLVLSWTLALIPIRFISPRPRFRHLACQPGLMASTATGLAIGFVGLLIVVPVLVSPRGAATNVLYIVMCLVPTFVGLAILASWMTLLAGRRWLAEPSWIDRLGRVAGVFWIVTGFVVTGMLSLVLLG